MRAFVAIEMPPHIIESLGALSGRLRASGARVTWVRPENMHLTLRFLGDVGEDAIQRMKAILSDACRGMTPFPISVNGTGAFPSVRRPNVIWAGVEPVEGGLATAQLAAESAARAIGLPPEDKPFRPHLTLARIKDPQAAQALMTRLEHEQGFDAGEFTVSNVSLFSSQLTPRGPIYARLEEFGF